MKLVTWAEAVAWICTRNSEEIAALADIAPSTQFEAVMRFYKVGIKTHLRSGDEEDRVTASKVGGAPFANAQDALRGLKVAVLAGLVPVRAFPRGSAVQEIVPFKDLAVTQWRLWDPDGGPSGFWSDGDGHYSWQKPVLVQSDLESLWPAPLTGRQSKANTLIRETLMAQDGKLKKDDALDIAQKCDGYRSLRIRCNGQPCNWSLVQCPSSTISASLKSKIVAILNRCDTDQGRAKLRWRSLHRHSDVEEWVGCSKLSICWK